jgi:hypothetical protein
MTIDEDGTGELDFEEFSTWLLVSEAQNKQKQGALGRLVNGMARDLDLIGKGITTQRAKLALLNRAEARARYLEVSAFRRRRPALFGWLDGMRNQVPPLSSQLQQQQQQQQKRLLLESSDRSNDIENENGFEGVEEDQSAAEAVTAAVAATTMSAGTEWLSSHDLPHLDRGHDRERLMQVATAAKESAATAFAPSQDDDEGDDDEEGKDDDEGGNEEDEKNKKKKKKGIGAKSQRAGGFFSRIRIAPFSGSSTPLSQPSTPVKGSRKGRGGGKNKGNNTNLASRLVPSAAKLKKISAGAERRAKAEVVGTLAGKIRLHKEKVRLKAVMLDPESEVNQELNGLLLLIEGTQATTTDGGYGGGGGLGGGGVGTSTPSSLTSGRQLVLDQTSLSQKQQQQQQPQQQEEERAAEVRALDRAEAR